MPTHIELHINKLEDAFQGNLWLGNCVIDTVESCIGYNHNFCIEGGNSIGQILEHMINWRVFTLEKIKGNYSYDIALNSKEDWNKDKHYSRDEYIRLIEKLKSSNKELIDLVRSNDEDWLWSKVPGRAYNFNFLINGIVEHDIYHCGQIAVLKKGADIKTDN